MTLLDRIRDVWTVDQARLSPFRVGGETVGWIDHDFLAALASEPETFIVHPGAVELAHRLITPAARTQAVEDALRRIYGRNQQGFGRWCDERTPVCSGVGAAPLFEIERAAVAVFGILTAGVHLNGYERESMRVWVARRAKTLSSQPGKLDQIVAGFLPFGTPPLDKLRAEAMEEAGIGPDIIASAVPGGFVTFCRAVPFGVQRGIVQVYDLALPPGFAPANRDGEIEAFRLSTPAEIMSVLERTDDFKFDCALVAIDFLMRHGLLDHRHPETPDLARWLRADPAPGAARP